MAGSIGPYHVVVLGSEAIAPDGSVIPYVHSPDRCSGRHCVVHHPSEHHMRRWPLRWRDGRSLFERLCPHGVGHPDPDQDEYWHSRHQRWHALRGCCLDRCCVAGAAV